MLKRRARGLFVPSVVKAVGEESKKSMNDDQPESMVPTDRTLSHRETTKTPFEESAVDNASSELVTNDFVIQVSTPSEVPFETNIDTDTIELVSNKSVEHGQKIQFETSSAIDKSLVSEKCDSSGPKEVQFNLGSMASNNASSFRRSRAKVAPMINIGPAISKETIPEEEYVPNGSTIMHKGIEETVDAIRNKKVDESSRSEIYKETAKIVGSAPSKSKHANRVSVNNIGSVLENKESKKIQDNIQVSKSVDSAEKLDETHTPKGVGGENKTVHESINEKIESHIQSSSTSSPFRRGKLKVAPKIFGASVMKSPSVNQSGTPERNKDTKEYHDSIVRTKNVEASQTTQFKDVKSDIICQDQSKDESFQTVSPQESVEVLPTYIFQRRTKSRFLPKGSSLARLASSGEVKKTICSPRGSALVGVKSQSSLGNSPPVASDVPSSAIEKDACSDEVVGTAEPPKSVFTAIVETLGAQRQPANKSPEAPENPNLDAMLIEKPEEKKREKVVPISIDLEQLQQRRSSLTLGELINCTVKNSRKMDPSCKMEAPDLDELMKAQITQRHTRRIDSNAPNMLTLDRIKKEFVEISKKEPGIVKSEPSDDKNSVNGETNNNSDAYANGTKSEFDDTPSNVFAPRLKMGEDGKFVLDEESLVIEQTSELMLNNGVVTQGSSMPIGTYQKTLSRFHHRNSIGCNMFWTEEELKRLYMGIQMVGVDFLMLMTLIPDRSHKELRLKFHRIDIQEPQWADKLLSRPLRYDRQLHISRYKAELRNMSRKLYEKRKLKLQFEAMRRNEKGHFNEWFLERDFEQEEEERQELLKKEAGKKTSSKKSKKRKTENKDGGDPENEDCISIDGQQDDTSQSSSSSLKPKNQRKRKTNDEGDQNVSGTMQAVADSNFIPQSKKPRGSRKSADKDTSSKRGPGRPVTTGESSMETINLSIQAAIERYQGIKSATEYLLEMDPTILDGTGNEYDVADLDPRSNLKLAKALNSPNNVNDPSFGNGFKSIAISLQFPQVAIHNENSMTSESSSSSMGSSSQFSAPGSSRTSANSSPGPPDLRQVATGTDMFDSAMNNLNLSIERRKRASESEAHSVFKSTTVVESVQESMDSDEMQRRVNLNEESRQQNQRLLAEVSKVYQNCLRESGEDALIIDETGSSGIVKQSEKEKLDEHLNAVKSRQSTQETTEVGPIVTHTQTAASQFNEKNNPTTSSGSPKDDQIEDYVGFTASVLVSIDRVLQKALTEPNSLEQYLKSADELFTESMNGCENETGEIIKRFNEPSTEGRVKKMKAKGFRKFSKKAKKEETKELSTESEISNQSAMDIGTEKSSSSVNACNLYPTISLENGFDNRQSPVKEGSSSGNIQYKNPSLPDKTSHEQNESPCKTPLKVPSKLLFKQSPLVNSPWTKKLMESSKLPEELADMLENEFSDGEISKLANEFNESFIEDTSFDRSEVKLKTSVEKETTLEPCDGSINDHRQSIPVVNVKESIASSTNLAPLEHHHQLVGDYVQFRTETVTRQSSSNFNDLLDPCVASSQESVVSHDDQDVITAEAANGPNVAECAAEVSGVERNNFAATVSANSDHRQHCQTVNSVNDLPFPPQLSQISISADGKDLSDDGFCDETDKDIEGGTKSSVVTEVGEMLGDIETENASKELTIYNAASSEGSNGNSGGNEQVDFSLGRVPSPPPIPENGEIGLIVIPEKLPYAFYFDGVNMIAGLVSESPDDPNGSALETEGENEMVAEVPVDITEGEGSFESFESGIGTLPEEEKNGLELQDKTKLSAESEREDGLSESGIEALEEQKDDLEVRKDETKLTESENTLAQEDNRTILDSEAPASPLVSKSPSRTEIHNSRVPQTPPKKSGKGVQLGFDPGFGTTPKNNRGNLTSSYHSSSLISTLKGKEQSNTSSITSKLHEKGQQTPQNKLGLKTSKEKSSPIVLIIDTETPVERTASVNELALLNDSELVPTVVLETQRDDHLIGEIMQETEVIDLDAIEETIGSQRQHNHQSHAVESEMGVFIPKIARRNQEMEQFIDVDLCDELDRTEHNFTIRH